MTDYEMQFLRSFDVLIPRQFTDERTFILLLLLLLLPMPLLLLLLLQCDHCGRSYKASTSVIHDSSVINISNLIVITTLES